MYILLIQFNNEIRQHEIPLLRGAIISKFRDNDLFHNHIDSGLRYSYPLIQYKRLGGVAAIIGVDKGAELLKTMITDQPIPMKLGRREVDMVIDAAYEGQFPLDFTETPETYEIKDWLPFNQSNYNEYKATQILTERISILEKILVGNILSMGKGTETCFQSNVECKITNLTSQKKTFYKGTELISVDATFQCNVQLPDFVGLGKGASIGHGVIRAI